MTKKYIFLAFSEYLMFIHNLLSNQPQKVLMYLTSTNLTYPQT